LKSDPVSRLAVSAFGGGDSPDVARLTDRFPRPDAKFLLLHPGGYA
jgi:hypothetical protein